MLTTLSMTRAFDWCLFRLKWTTFKPSSEFSLLTKNWTLPFLKSRRESLLATWPKMNNFHFWLKTEQSWFYIPGGTHISDFDQIWSKFTFDQKVNNPKFTVPAGLTFQTLTKINQNSLLTKNWTIPILQSRRDSYFRLSPKMLNFGLFVSGLSKPPTYLCLQHNYDLD